MARTYRSSDIIESAKRKAMLPETQVTFTEDDFLAFANEEMDLGIVPFVMSFREDYYQNSIFVTLESGKSRYHIPYRAIGNKIRDLQYVDGSGKVYPMRRIFVEDLHKFDGGFNDQDTSSSNKYYIENDEIVLASRPTANGAQLKIIFYLRPNTLVMEENVATVVAVNRTTGEIVVDQIPSNIEVGSLIDCIEEQSPSKVLKYDIPVLSVVDGDVKIITIDPALIDIHLTPGDQISLAQTTARPQLPAELQSLLAQRVAARCLEALGDQAGLQAANAKIAEIEQKVIPILDNRVDGSPMKVNANVGLLRSIRNYWRR